MRNISQIIFVFLIVLFVGCEYSDNGNLSELKFNVACISLCEDEEFMVNCSEVIQDNQNRIFYDKTTTKTDSSLLVTFDFVDDCCLNFTGDYIVENEILKLYFYLNDDENYRCECKCNYRMVYQFQHLKTPWKRIRIIKLKS